MLRYVIILQGKWEAVREDHQALIQYLLTMVGANANTEANTEKLKQYFLDVSCVMNL